MEEIIFKIRYFVRGLSKSLKKVNFIFPFKHLPFNGQNYQKQKGSGTCDRLLFRLQNEFKNIPLFAIYHLIKFDDVM